jgi:hypothetical protein
MYLMYVDESGDPGKVNSPTTHYILSAIVIHETSWLNILNDVIAFRRALKTRYQILMKEEIHASVFMSRQPKLRNPIARNDRLDLLKKCIDWLNARTDVSIITVRVNKANTPDPFEYAWRVLIQRFDNTLAYRNFPGGVNNTDLGMIFADNTDGNKLTKLLREMRRFNQVPNMIQVAPGARNIPLRAIIEDPNFRDSSHSYILQMVDVVAYFARQHHEPKKYIKQKGGANFYGRLSKVINQYARYGPANHKIINV